MKIGDTEILTPYPELGGDPTHYQPDFRGKIAKELANGADPSTVPDMLMRNNALRKHVKFLTLLHKGHDIMELYRDYPEHNAALAWNSTANGSQTRYYLDALLLSGQDIDIIAKDLGLDPEYVRVYEQLYMHCRDPKDYALRCSPRTLFSLACGPIIEAPRTPAAHIQWRLIAIHTGYSGLIYQWGWETFAHGRVKPVFDMDRNLQLCGMQMNQRIRSGSLSNEDMTAQMSLGLEYKRLDAELAAAGTGPNAFAQVVMRMLSMMAPKVADSPAKTQAYIAAAHDAADKKMLAERNISEHAIEDKGVLTSSGHSVHGAAIKAKFKDVMPHNGESP